MEKRFLSLREASRYLAMSQDYLYKLVERKGISHYRFGRSIRFDLGELTEWVERFRVEQDA